MKKMIAFLTAVLLLLSGCSSAALNDAGKELEDAITNISDADNKYVLMVKGGYRTDDPSVTYEDAFFAFFGTPRWKYFKGTEEQDVVEFTGDCIYQEVMVKARIQFVVDEENGTFQATYLAFNEVPQDALTLAVVISKAFEAANEAGTESTAGPSAQAVTSMDEAQRLVEDWMTDHPIGPMAGVGNGTVESSTGAEYFVFELWIEPRNFAGLVYVRNPDGLMTFKQFDFEDGISLDAWYAEWCGGKNTAIDLCYRGISLADWIGCTADSSYDTFGWPDYGTIIDGYLYEGGEYFGYDGGISFIIDYQTGTIGWITGAAEAIEANGLTLDLSRAELIDLFGTPESETPVHDEEIYPSDYYVIDFTLDGVSVQMKLPNINSKATSVIISKNFY